MTLEEAYAVAGGNYQNILKRLGSEASVLKFSKMFLADDSYKTFTVFLKRATLMKRSVWLTH